MTDRWQKFTDVKLSEKVLTDLSGFCDEFLIHAVDVEGKAAGFDRNLVRILKEKVPCIPVSLCRRDRQAGGIERIRAGKRWEIRLYDRKRSGSVRWGHPRVSYYCKPVK